MRELIWDKQSQSQSQRQITRHGRGRQGLQTPPPPRGEGSVWGHPPLRYPGQNALPVDPWEWSACPADLFLTNRSRPFLARAPSPVAWVRLTSVSGSPATYRREIKRQRNGTGTCHYTKADGNEDRSLIPLCLPPPKKILCAKTYPNTFEKPCFRLVSNLIGVNDPKKKRVNSPFSEQSLSANET